MSLPSTPPKSKARNEVLIKGLTIALIGLIILLAHVFKPDSGIAQLFAQSHIVGWFALVLGLAFIGQHLWLRLKK